MARTSMVMRISVQLLVGSSRPSQEDLFHVCGPAPQGPAAAPEPDPLSPEARVPVDLSAAVRRFARSCSYEIYGARVRRGRSRRTSTSAACSCATWAGHVCNPLVQAAFLSHGLCVLDVPPAWTAPGSQSSVGETHMSTEYSYMSIRAAAPFPFPHVHQHISR